MEAVVSALHADAWRGRRVFLTGHTGFKGGWLALWLSRLEAEIRGYALDPHSPGLFDAAGVATVLQDMRGDLNDVEKLTLGLKEFQPEVVFHLAAQPLVRASYTDPLGTYRANVMGTAHLLEAVRHCSSVRAVVCVTTDKCYDNREWVWGYRETDALGGHDPYSSSKACAELVAAAYRKSFFDAASEPKCLIATARAGNVIGGGDWSHGRLLPDLIRGFAAHEAVRIRRPDSVRPWQHVLEPIFGYFRLAEELLQGNAVSASAYNFGPDPGDAWPVSRIVSTVAKLWGPGAHWSSNAELGVHETGLLKLDASKARAELGWRPALPLNAALEWVVDWHQAHASGEDMHAFTLRQIEAYEQLQQSRT